MGSSIDHRAPLLEARGVSKRFPGVLALDDVSATFRAGEVTAVMGENGAGKSTLMKALAGVHEPDAGEVLWEGKPVRVRHVADAERLGIAFIHQELNLCENMSVAENIFLGREPRRGGIFLDRARLRVEAKTVLARAGLNVSPDAPVDTLSIGQRQMVEIARALSREARLVIMDEPTSSLTAGETAKLFDVVNELRAAGIAVVFISHRLKEVRQVADRVLVLRDGRNSGELGRKEITHDRIVSLMIGREFADTGAAAEPPPPGPVLLEIDGLRTALWPAHEVSLRLCAGEILGVAGLVGAGRTELARALFGIDRPLAGTVRLNGRTLPPGDPRAAIRAGLALAPEDRKEQGLLLDLSIRENIALPGLDRLSRGPFVNEPAVTALAEDMRGRLGIRTVSVEKTAGQLSGGNQQKIVIARWLALSPAVFILDEPTRGVDVGAKREIYRVIESLAASGAAVLMISSDLEEILRLSHRVLVLHEGRAAGELARRDLTEEAVMRLATGRSS